MTPSRRDFLRGALTAAGAAALGGGLAARGAMAPALSVGPGSGVVELPLPTLPDPAGSGIEHVVVVMMENRSFDHFLGWLPGANGIQSGLSYPDPAGNQVATWHADVLNGCGFNDPDHSWDGGRTQYDGGKMDGFLLDPANDRYAVSYYEEADRPFMSSLARNFTSCDNYFCSILGPTYPNRFFMHAAATDRLDNTTNVSTIPTIWDQLNQVGGPTGRYYFSDLPVLALWGQKYLPISAHYAQFLADAKAGTLPNVAFVDPRFEDEGDGTSNDDHPLADIRAGDALLSEIFDAVSSGPNWDRTVLVVNYDEWGGFFDHVAPSRVTPGIAGVDTDVIDGKVLTGFRVPAIVASPWTKGTPAAPGISHGFFDHTSVLKLIEWRWGLRPVSARDASTLSTDPGNLATILNLASPDASVPALPSLLPFVPESCTAKNPSLGGGPVPAAGAARSSDTWAALRSSSLLKGWA
ncbi:MAG: alkaline phosphatase family protein [Acidimicrobiales bacterium]